MGARVRIGRAVDARLAAAVIGALRAGEATVAHVVVVKYADYLPLYRQAQI